MSNSGRVRAMGGGLYHVILRTVASRFYFTDEEKDAFTQILWKAALFGYIQVLSHAILDNHVHLVVYVPERRPVSDEELIDRLADLYSREKANEIRDLWEFRKKHKRGRVVKLEKEKYIRRMFNLSSFVKTVKENYTQGYNRRQNGRIGTVWAGRFKSILLSGKDIDLPLITAAYVDLNPAKAGKGPDPGAYPWSGIGAALNRDRGAMAGILALGQLTGFASEETTPERATLLYYDILLGKAKGRIKSLFETRIVIEENDPRFDPSLWGREITLFDLIRECKLLCFEKGGMLSKNVDEMDGIRDKHPAESILPGYYSAHGLRKTVVIPRK